MKFKQWLRKWLMSDDVEKYPEREVGLIATNPVRKNRIGGGIDRPDDTITFKVYGARGGKIVEASHYDPKTDRSESTLHIIHDDADFAQTLSGIVTVEYLSR